MVRNCPVVSSYFLISIIIILFSLRNFQMTRLLCGVIIPGPKQRSITAQGEPPCKSEPLHSGMECHKPAEWLVGDHSRVSLVLVNVCVKVYPNVCVCKSYWVVVCFKNCPLYDNLCVYRPKCMVIRWHGHFMSHVGVKWLWNIGLCNVTINSSGDVIDATGISFMLKANEALEYALSWLALVCIYGYPPTTIIHPLSNANSVRTHAQYMPWNSIYALGTWLCLHDI